MLVVLGDALLDRDLEGRAERLSPEGPVPVVEDLVQRTRPGGAGLAAALAAFDGREVTLITALASDESGAELRRMLDAAGIDVIDLGLQGSTPEKIRVRSDGRTLLRLDRGVAGSVNAANGRATRVLGSASAVLVSDYGRGVAADPKLRQALTSLAPRVPIVWDPHPRGSQPTPSVRLATPNIAEAVRFTPEIQGDGLDSIAERGRALARRWSAAGVAITLGKRGALLVTGDGPPTAVPAPLAVASDPCGAGDRFAAAAAGMLSDGALLSQAVSAAVISASKFVGDGGAAGLRLERRAAAGLVAEDNRLSQAQSVIARTRANGGTVVATGGCFDLLHAGHVRLLKQARALGDCLVVCLNDDASVRRLKGPGRPLVPEEDRAAVLGALDCVDAVVVFDEDTPEAILSRLRPDIFAKGGDYAVADLPEAELIKRWGGQAVLLPYLEGRSTSLLVSEAARRFAR
jgi:D-beta-D-heptose 7-phosphate kinase/D-beta-D-heptose 1-phosphate adenosyltransferase